MKKSASCFLVVAFYLAGACSGGGENKEPESQALSDYDRLYIVRRPQVGSLHVIDVAGEKFERKVLASSLQGLVNRRSARIYLLDGTQEEKNRPWETTNEREAALFWLSLYEEQYGVKKVWEGGLDEALNLFASEVRGYTLAVREEPWTINAATTAASLGGSLVAFETERPLLDSIGIEMTESMAGRWKDSNECYRDLKENYYSRMDHPGLAILSPEEYRLRDFLIEQGLLTIYARPFNEGWMSVTEIIAALPQNIPVFGYLSLTGVEEFFSVTTLSHSGKYLIPTDTTANLSFHVSMKPGRIEESPLKTRSSASCRMGDANITVNISDGDNLAIPLNRYAWPSFWRSGSRGEMPFGWSFSLALPSLAPAAWEYYYSTASDNDEIIGMLGIGYAHPSFYPDDEFFLTRSFQKMLELGLPTFWSLDIPLYLERAPGWETISNYQVSGYPSGVLYGYIGLGGPRSFKTSSGMPVIVASNTYQDTPEDLAARVQEILSQESSARPPIVFLNAVAWTNPLQDMVEVLEPLADQGARFFLPHDAFSCVE